jgi:hypothetical protein
VLIIVGVVWVFLEIYPTIAKTYRLHSAFTIGQPITDFAIPNAKILILSFDSSKKSGEGISFFLRRNTSHLAVPDSLKKAFDSHIQEISKGEMEDIPSYIQANPEIYSRFDEVNVTLFGGSIPYRGSFSIRYDNSGKVVHIEEPCFGD